MKFQIDHDLHIHTYWSSCSNDPGQNIGRVLAYGQQNGFRRVCVTNHFWDAAVPGTEDPDNLSADWYRRMNWEHIRQDLPLPKGENIDFLFGCETEIKYDGTIGISRAMADRLDMVIVPITHLHFPGFTVQPEDLTEEGLARRYVERFDTLLNADLPFAKTGLAHPCQVLLDGTPPGLGARMLARIGDGDYESLFRRAAEKGMGIELNLQVLDRPAEDLEIRLRPYRIAARCGCRFYLGSDAHHPADFQTSPQNFQRLVDLLELQEEQKFIPQK